VYVVAGLLALIATLERRRVALRFSQGIGLAFLMIGVLGFGWGSLRQLLDFGHLDVAVSLCVAASCYLATRASLMHEMAWRRRHQSYWAAFDDRLRGGFEEVLDGSRQR
jgi:hypothetical protein